MILIINSDPQVLENIRTHLGRFDHRLSGDTAENSNLGWTMIRGCRPWMVICDSQDSNAFEFFVRVRENCPEAYFIFTGDVLTGEMISHADAVLPKISYDKLVPHFRAARERMRQRKTAASSRKRATRRTQDEIQIVVGTGELHFTVGVPAGIVLKDFLAQRGRTKIREVRIFRRDELLGSALDTVLEDGDRVEIQADDGTE